MNPNCPKVSVLCGFPALFVRFRAVAFSTPFAPLFGNSAPHLPHAPAGSCSGSGCRNEKKKAPAPLLDEQRRNLRGGITWQNVITFLITFEHYKITVLWGYHRIVFNRLRSDIIHNWCIDICRCADLCCGVPATYICQCECVRSFGRTFVHDCIRFVHVCIQNINGYLYLISVYISES